MLLFAVLLSCISCSDPGADIEVIDRATDGEITGYIDQTQFTKEETASIIVHFEVSDTVANGKELNYGVPTLEKYTHNGWTQDGYKYMTAVLKHQKSDEGLFDYHFSFGEVDADPTPGTYRLTFSFWIHGERYIGTIQLIFRVV